MHTKCIYIALLSVHQLLQALCANKCFWVCFLHAFLWQRLQLGFTLFALFFPALYPSPRAYLIQTWHLPLELSGCATGCPFTSTGRSGIVDIANLMSARSLIVERCSIHGFTNSMAKSRMYCHRVFYAFQVWYSIEAYCLSLQCNHAFRAATPMIV